MKTGRLLLTSAREANYLAIIALICLFAKILVLNRWTAIFPGAFELGQIVEAILGSILASYVFYFLVVHLPWFKDRERIDPFVLRHIGRVVGVAIDLLSQISKISGVTIELETVSETTLLSALTQMKLGGPAPMAIGPGMLQATWFDYFMHGITRTKTSVSKIFRHVTLISSERIALLVAIDDCSFFYQVESLQGLQIKPGSNFGFVASTMIKYFEICRELRFMEAID